MRYIQLPWRHSEEEAEKFRFIVKKKVPRRSYSYIPKAVFLFIEVGGSPPSESGLISNHKHLNHNMNLISDDK